jgi:hypothetical protein
MQDQTDVPLVPVIVLSESRGVDALSRSRFFPVREYQLKPLAPYQLAQRIRRLIDQTPSPGGLFG